MRRVAMFVCAVGLPLFALVATAASYKPPRTLEGKPSFEGTWTNATLTPLQRPARYKALIIPPSEIEKETNNHPQVVRQRTDDNQSTDSKLTGADLSRGRGYNAFWIDPGMTFNRVRGEYRTSFIIDPANGQIPSKTPLRVDAERATGSARFANFDGPEARPLGERCIINSGSAGPPMMTYLYNNNYEIVQTATHLVIRAEMINYARIIRIGGKHISQAIHPLHGDSIGWWEGDTLVVETTQFSPHHAQTMVALSEDAKVIERFTRYSDDQLLYEFTVEDPSRYTQTWRGEYSFNATKDLVFEYACHEGNYALTGILAGAREQERQAAKAK